MQAARDWLVLVVLVVGLGGALVYGVGMATIEPSATAARPHPVISYERDLRSHPLLRPAVRHLSLLGAAPLLLLGFTYWLNNWDLVYSPRGDLPTALGDPVQLRQLFQTRWTHRTDSKPRQIPVQGISAETKGG